MKGKTLQINRPTLHTTPVAIVPAFDGAALLPASQNKRPLLLTGLGNALGRPSGWRNVQRFISGQIDKYVYMLITWIPMAFYDSSE